MLYLPYIPVFAGFVSLGLMTSILVSNSKCVVHVCEKSLYLKFHNKLPYENLMQ